MTSGDTRGSSEGLKAQVRIPAGEVSLMGSLVQPNASRRVVLFAHGSGSGRHSSRNQFVARALQSAGIGTLLIDLLSEEEEEAGDALGGMVRFDIRLLAGRLSHAIGWLRANPATTTASIGLFGASTGGGAALVTAADRPAEISAVVSRGGRPDLAGDALPLVVAPTLLIVGSLDIPVIGMNQAAMERMTNARADLEIVPGASHLFEEPGALEAVAGYARAWLVEHLEKVVSAGAGNVGW